MRAFPVTLLLTVGLGLFCSGLKVSGARVHTVEKRDTEETTPPFGVMSTCICYPMSEELPAGFPGKGADPAQLNEWARNQGGGASTIESAAESQASANVNAPTNVHIFKDDSVDPNTLVLQ